MTGFAIGSAAPVRGLASYPIKATIYARSVNAFRTILI